jgi:hypothetical protein
VAEEYGRGVPIEVKCEADKSQRDSVLLAGTSLSLVLSFLVN